MSFGFVVANLSASETGVQETFQKLLSLAVVLQLIPFLYMFGALLKIAFSDSFVKAVYSKTTLILSGASGLVTTILGIALAFFPGAASHVSLFLRGLDVWRNAIFSSGLRRFSFLFTGGAKRQENSRRLFRLCERGCVLARALTR